MTRFAVAPSATGTALAAIDPTTIDAAIVLHGCGREGLMLHAWAMQGDMACPPVRARHTNSGVFHAI